MQKKNIGVGGCTFYLPPDNIVQLMEDGLYSGHTVSIKSTANFSLLHLE